MILILCHAHRRRTARLKNIETKIVALIIIQSNNKVLDN